jgi:hypothetical protein
MSYDAIDAAFDRDTEETRCVAWIGDVASEEDWWEVQIRGLFDTVGLEWIEIEARDASDGEPFDAAWLAKWNKQLVDALESQ